MYKSIDVADRIKSIANAKSIKIVTMLKELDMGLNTMQNFKTSMPKSDTLARIADYLDVSMDVLMGRHAPNGFDFSISKSALNVASIYDQLDEHGKRMIDTVSQIEIERSTEAERATDAIINAAIQARSEIDAEESV